MGQSQEKATLQSGGDLKQGMSFLLWDGQQAAFDQRNEEAEVFFNSGSTEQRIQTQQIKIQKARPISRLEQENLITNKKLLALYKFFDSQAFITINNFEYAQKLLASYFDEPSKFIDRIVKIKEHLGKSFPQHHKFGELKLDCVYKGSYIKLSISHSKIKDVEQFISINLVSNKPSSMIVYTQWNHKNKKSQLIRSVDVGNLRGTTGASLEFDAKVWKAFNTAGIYRKNFLKTLDCIERQSDKLPEFFEALNKKTLLQVLEKNLVNDLTMKASGRTRLIKFRTNNNQKISIKLNPIALDLTVEI